jgi:hypothetical protein
MKKGKYGGKCALLLCVKSEATDSLIGIFNSFAGTTADVARQSRGSRNGEPFEKEREKLWVFTKMSI